MLILLYRLALHQKWLKTGLWRTRSPIEGRKLMYYRLWLTLYNTCRTKACMEQKRETSL